MNLKIVFGIIVPSVIIVLLAVFASLDIGFSVEESYPKQISISSEVFQNGQIKTAVKIGEIDITNDYLFSKRYDLQQLRACLIDNSKVKENIDAGTLEYSGGDYPLNEGLVYDYYGNSERNVQIGAYANKKVKIYLRPSDYFNYGKLGYRTQTPNLGTNYSDLISEYGQYDELVIIKVENSGTRLAYARYSNCYDLNDETLSKAIHIQLVA